MGNSAGLPLRFLALGDSYTIGEAVAEEGRWPMQLAAALAAAGLRLAQPRILATTGWTTDELAAALAASGIRPPWDLVSLQIGVNDQYRGRGAERFIEGFNGLLSCAAGLAGNATRVLVVSIPDWGVTPFAREGGHDPARIAAEIDRYNALARQRALAAGAHWVDVTGFSREAGASLAADGLHPDAGQYTRWQEALGPAATKVLRES